MATIGAFNDPLLRLLKQPGGSIWNIYISNWLEGVNATNLRLKPSVPVTVDENGIIQLIGELKRCLEEKPSHEEFLEFKLLQNEPDFKVYLKYTNRRVKDLNQAEMKAYAKNNNEATADSNAPVVDLGAGFNTHYQEFKDNREDSAYIYEGEGKRVSLVMSVPEPVIQDFINQLQNELA